MKKIVPAVMVTLVVTALPAHLAVAKPSHAGKLGKAEKQSKLKKCKKSHAVGFVVGGTFAGHDAGSVTISVTEASKHARAYLAADSATFSKVGVRLSFEGVADTGDGVVGFDDVVASDSVKVIGKLTQPKKACAGVTTLSVRKIAVTREQSKPAPQPVA